MYDIVNILLQVCFEVVGYLLEELRDGKNYEQFQKDIADANIFIGSLIFIEELAEKVSRQDAFAHDAEHCLRKDSRAGQTCKLCSCFASHSSTHFKKVVGIALV